MENRREIPGATKNAASRSDHERVFALLDQLGLNTENGFVDKLGRSRATYYRLKKFNATTAMVREVEEALVREAQRRNQTTAPTRTEHDELIAQWCELGEQLLSADPARFHSTLDGLRDMVESTKLQQQAIHKMFRATPDPSRR
jgi:hypothetical protein